MHFRRQEKETQIVDVLALLERMHVLEVTMLELDERLLRTCIADPLYRATLQMMSRVNDEQNSIHRRLQGYENQISVCEEHKDVRKVRGRRQIAAVSEA